MNDDPIARLEKTILRLKWIIAILAFLTVPLPSCSSDKKAVAPATTNTSVVPPNPAGEVAEILRARRIEIINRAGESVMVLTPIKGRLEKGGGAALMMYGDGCEFVASTEKNQAGMGLFCGPRTFMARCGPDSSQVGLKHHGILVSMSINDRAIIAASNPDYEAGIYVDQNSAVAGATRGEARAFAGVEATRTTLGVVDVKGRPRGGLVLDEDGKPTIFLFDENGRDINPDPMRAR